MKFFKHACLLVSLGVLLGADGSSCTQNILLDSRPDPVIIPSGNNQTSFNRTLTVDLRAYPDAKTLTWEFGDGGFAPNLSTDTGRTVQHQFTGSGTFVVTVHLFNAGDITTGSGPRGIGKGSIPITIVGPNTPPIASFTVADITSSGVNPSPLTKHFDATSSRDPGGSIVSFDWDFGDGQTDSGQVVNHEFTTSGHFDVQLIVTDDRGATTSTDRTIVVNAPPAAQFTFTPDQNNTLSVHFDGGASSDSDGTIVSFSWSFGDNTPSANTPQVTHLYAAPGTYSVKLTVTDDLGSTNTNTQQVTVHATNPFVSAISPVFAQVNTQIAAAILTGENFTQATGVILRHGSTVINGSGVSVQTDTTISAGFDFNGVPTGDYDVVVQVPGKPDGVLAAGFRVVTPDMVRLTTSLGEIVFKMDPNAPITTQNFLQYTTDTHYDGTIFHRVVPNFVVQGGGLLPDGSQKPGVRPPIQNEFSSRRSNIRGTVAMAKLGGDPNSATDQFFVNLADNSANLDTQNGGFTVFANVTDGMDVVDAIAAVPTDANNRPLTDVLIISARRE